MWRVHHPLVTGWLTHRWPLQEILFHRKIFVLWGFKEIMFVSSAILTCENRQKKKKFRNQDLAPYMEAGYGA